MQSATTRPIIPQRDRKAAEPGRPAAVAIVPAGCRDAGRGYDSSIHAKDANSFLLTG